MCTTVPGMHGAENRTPGFLRARQDSYQLTFFETRSQVLQAGQHRYTAAEADLEFLVLFTPASVSS